MRLLSILSAALLPLAALAAKKAAPTDAFVDFHAKEQAAGGPVKLTEASYRKLVAAPRNHTAAILFTALEARFGCQVCQIFAPEWELVARSWMRGDRAGQSQVVFATLDFVDARDVFQHHGLNTAPMLIMYQPTVGPNAKPDNIPVRLDFASGVQNAESVQAFIARSLPDGVPKPAVHRPINWLRLISLTTLGLGGVTAVAVLWKYIYPILYNRNLWAALSVIGILLFTSGHMFNHIRATPYVGGDGRGGLTYFAPGFQNQLGMESQLVAAMYGVLAFATISLALKVPRMADEKSQQVAVFIWGSVIFFVYSLLLSIFRQKNAGYPFFLPPF